MAADGSASDKTFERSGVCGRIYADRTAELHFSDKKTYDQYLASVSPSTGVISIALTTCVDLSVIFGLRDEDRHFFTTDQCELLEYLHDGYRSGEWKPKIGSSTRFALNLFEHYAGGMPQPHQREELMAKATTHCLKIMKEPRGLFSGRTFGGFDAGGKREKFLRDLDRVAADGGGNG